MNESFRGYIPQLDGLRALGISLVILHHFWPIEGPLRRFEHIAHLGWIGVDLFFVISGFLICGILLDTRDARSYFRNFYIRRSLRIFPLYYLFVSLMFLAIPLLERRTDFIHESGSIWWYLLYGTNFRETITGHEPAYVLAPLWSLAIEEQFYITFPLLVMLLGPRRLWRFLWCLVFAAPVFRIVTLFLWTSNHRIQYLSTFSRLDSIAIGCLIATGFRLGRIRLSASTAKRIAIGGVSMVILTFAAGGLNRVQPFCRIIGYSLTSFAFAALVLWAVIGRPLWLRASPLTGLGKICYGVYLLQRPAQVVLGKLLDRAGIPLSPGALLFANCAFAIMVAAVSWNVFEKNILKLKDRFAPSKPDDVPAVGDRFPLYVES